MRFIVTGAAGLIGSNVVAALNRRGHTDILAVDHINHPEKERNLSGVSTAAYMDKAEFRSAFRNASVPAPEAVFHLGACSATTETDEAYLQDNNFLYTRQLCEWSIRHDARFIYASSAATYGDGAHGYSDSHDRIPKLKPMNLYGESKQRFDLWALRAGLLDRIVGLKYFNVYGPGENHKGGMRSVVNKAHREILDTGHVSLFRSHRPDVEDGMQDRDFIYVNDAVEVTLFFLEHRTVSGIFNCGTGLPRTWLDLAQALFSAMDRPPRIRFRDMPAAIRDTYQYHTRADITKLRNAGYVRPFTSLEDGIDAYVREHLAPRANETPAGVTP